MNELKNCLRPLLERIQSKSVILCLFTGLLMSGGLQAQQSASHTVTIRIIRPIQFSVEAAENESGDDSQPKDAGVRLTWRSDSKPKRVTVSKTRETSEEFMELSMPSGNSPIPAGHMRLAATETDRKSKAVPADAKDRLFYTVMDI